MGPSVAEAVSAYIFSVGHEDSNECVDAAYGNLHQKYGMRNFGVLRAV
jgi:hypothetical protein